MKKYSYLLLLASWFIVSQTQAQDREFNPLPRYVETQKKYTFAIQPMQWFNWGWRFDFETRLGDGPGWLQFGPAVYSVTKKNHHFYDDNYAWHKDFIDFGIREPFVKLNGGGLDINYKRFIDPYRSLYFASGVSYTRFNIDYNAGWAGEWKDYTEDGLLYHEYIHSYTQKINTQHINRMSVNQYFGFQVPSRHAFLFDMFVGISYRHALSDKDKPSFDNYSYSYGYSGFVFMTGVRFGIGIK